MATHSHAHDHDHSHPHRHFGHSHADHAPRAIAQAIGITIVFMLVEFVGGWIANSLALISDGAHMLTDVGAMLLSLFALWVARKPSTPTMSFGYHRAEILGALASGLTIWGISGALIYEAIQRFRSPPEVKGPVVFVVATVGLAANLLSMRALHDTKHNMNVRAAYLHLLSDAMGSVAAIIAGLVLWFTNFHLIDPIVTVLLAALMLFSSFGLVREAVGVLMESAPAHVDPSIIRSDLGRIKGVKEVHDLHIWTVASGRLALSVHLIAMESERVLEAAHELLREHFGIIHTTIQIEHPDKFSSERCYDCN